VRNRYILFADLVAIVLCVAAAFVLRLDWLAPFSAGHPFADAVRFSMLTAPLVKLPVFYAFGLYARYWRYVALPDLLTICVAVTVASVAFSLSAFAAMGFGWVGAFPRSVPAIDWTLTLLAIAGIRVAVRVYAEARSPRQTGTSNESPRRVLIAGAGDAGAMVLRELHRNPQLGLDAVGFIDDAVVKLGKRIHGLRVLGPLDALERIVADYRVEEIIIAMPTARGAVVRRLADAARHAGVPARVLPGVFELLDGGVSVSRLRTLDIADLLRRTQVQADPETARYLSGQVVLVTGAGGSIGSELCRQAARAGASTLILLGHGENSIFEIAGQLSQHYPAVRMVPVIADVRDGAALQRIFAEHRPRVVFHAAAHKHVPLMESHPHEAITNNVRGTQLLVEAALEARVERFVLISTDKAVAPSSVMGASKKMAEMIVRDAARRSGRRFMAVRFGNVLGSRGSVVPFFRRQIETGGPVTVTHPDMTRFFMTIPEAVYLVLKAGGLAQGGELFVLNMGEPVRIVDLAHDLIRLSGYSFDDVQVVFTGLRPGEKLSEELWEAESRLEPVGEGDAFRVQEPVPPLEGESLAHAVKALTEAAQRGDALAIHHLLSEALPTFVSSLHADVSDAQPAPHQPH
jgi:FlaA1/EpsC-like NDP-sugar epimerase